MAAPYVIYTYAIVCIYQSIRCRQNMSIYGDQYVAEITDAEVRNLHARLARGDSIWYLRLPKGTFVHPEFSGSHLDLHKVLHRPAER